MLAVVRSKQPNLHTVGAPLVDVTAQQGSSVIVGLAPGATIMTASLVGKYRYLRQTWLSLSAISHFIG